MSEVHIYPVDSTIASNAHINDDQYREMYQQSTINPQGFWRQHGQILDWITPYTKVKNTSFDSGHVSIKWFEDGELNVSANCIDRHLADRGDQAAIIWDQLDPDDTEYPQSGQGNPPGQGLCICARPEGDRKPASNRTTALGVKGGQPYYNGNRKLDTVTRLRQKNFLSGI